MDNGQEKNTTWQDSLGQRVRNIRKQLGLTQEELAERAGLHYSYIGQVERGDKKPSLNSLRRVAGALNIGLDFLLEEQDNYEINETELLQKQLWKLTRNRPRQDLELLLEIARSLFVRIDELNNKRED